MLRGAVHSLRSRQTLAFCDDHLSARALCRWVAAGARPHGPPQDHLDAGTVREGGADELVRGIPEQVPVGADGAPQWNPRGDAAYRRPVAALGISAAWRAAGAVPRDRRRPR